MNKIILFTWITSIMVGTMISSCVSDTTDSWESIYIYEDAAVDVSNDASVDVSLDR